MKKKEKVHIIQVILEKKTTQIKSTLGVTYGKEWVWKDFHAFHYL